MTGLIPLALAFLFIFGLLAVELFKTARTSVRWKSGYFIVFGLAICGVAGSAIAGLYFAGAFQWLS